MPDKHFRIGHHRRRRINVLIVKMREQLESVYPRSPALVLAGEPRSSGSVRRQHSPGPAGCKPPRSTGNPNRYLLMPLSLFCGFPFLI